MAAPARMQLVEPERWKLTVEAFLSSTIIEWPPPLAHLHSGNETFAWLQKLGSDPDMPSQPLPQHHPTLDRARLK